MKNNGVCIKNAFKNVCRYFRYAKIYHDCLANKKIEEKTWKLFGEEILKKLRDTGARVEISKAEINEISISKGLDLSVFLID